MDKLNVVFIMGAGFSAEGGSPLMSNFIDKARKIYKRSDENEFINNSMKDFDDVYKSIGELHSMLAKAYLDLDNIETLFGALEFGLIINKFGNKERDEIEKLRDSLIKVIVTTIEYSIKYQYTIPDLIIYPLPVYLNFFRRLKNFEANCNFSFITFNYDLIIDVGLESSLMKYNYSLDNQTFSEIPLLKLHGSLNWFAEDDKKILTFPWPDKKLISNIFSTNKLPSETIYEFLPIGSEIIKSGKVPLIIPPTLNKFKYQEQLKNIWAKAASVLSEAELIFIIGYSMPETDVFFKYLYSLGIDSPKYLNKLIVINLDGGLQSKFSALTNSQNNFKKFQFIPGTFSEYIERIFTEIRNLVE